MSSREEHLNWCKQRALEYLDSGDIVTAFKSMCSDLQKHPDTQNHTGMILGTQLIIGGHLKKIDEARKFIEGFN